MRRMQPAPAVAVTVVAALVALLGYGVVHRSPTTSIDGALADGRRPAAPTLHLPRLGGTATARLVDWRGRVVVLNFWASWCGPCREESSLLERWHRRLEPVGGMVVGVDVQDVTSDAQAFVRRHRLTYPMLRDGDGASAKPFEVRGYPETLVIDRRGHIAAVARGPIDDAFMQAEVEPLLEERA